jgi:transposase-like protein
MKSKSEAAYINVFKRLKEEFNVEVASAMTDYEYALRSAIKKVYPDAELLGCWFHFCQVNKI